MEQLILNMRQVMAAELSRKSIRDYMPINEEFESSLRLEEDQ